MPLKKEKDVGNVGLQKLLSMEKDVVCSGMSVCCVVTVLMETDALKPSRPNSFGRSMYLANRQLIS